MSTTKLEEMLHALKQPFHPSEIYWKPGSVSKDGAKALALPYATLRAYQNRLDEVCGVDWSVTYLPWGERIICQLTIGGTFGELSRAVTRASTGEPDSQSEKSEIAGTAAEAQAFKRACAMWNLGRYLYHLPSVWVDYDAQTRQFTEGAKAKLHGIVALHYQRAMQAETEAEESSQSTDMEAAPEGENADEAVPAVLRKQFHRLGRELYGDRWTEVRQRNVERITNGQNTSATDLTATQMQKLIDGMQQLKRTRKTQQEADVQSKEREA